MATAAATGQSLFWKNSVHRVWPIISAFEPPSRSGMTNSPAIGMKHNSTPAKMPDADSGMVINQNALHRGAPRSAAASSSDSSFFSRLAESGRNMHRREE